jgi:fructokinase
MNQQLIVGFGEALVDLLPSGEVVGGAPLNFALRAAEIGRLANCNTSLVTRIGADERGERILARLRDSQLDTAHIQVDSQLQTGYVDVTLENGQPSYVIADEVAWDAIRWDEPLAELAHQTTTICFGTLAQRHHASRLSLERFLEVAQSALKILDINFRRPLPNIDVVEFSLQAAHVLKCNEEELLQLAEWLRLENRQSATEIAAELQSRFELKSVFWTRGAEGCCWQEGQSTITDKVPVLTAEPHADTVGAGDAASAALAVGMTAGWPPEQIVSVANRCGAYAASRRGPTVPLDEQTLAAIRSIVSTSQHD